ncbi:hypothetical protein [Microbacterium kunmingense]|uniref:hypothetical protein n=1 Tax=Microbacterium kunmingense TaxID=2915939 RepID=UPI002005FBBF|nr:hypothetical protein [Microbacterium kunmingense]
MSIAGTLFNGALTNVAIKGAVTNAVIIGNALLDGAIITDGARIVDTLRPRVSSSIKRVPVNPNRVSRRNPSWAVVGFEEVSEVPHVGELVTAMQPDDDGDFLSTGRVEHVDYGNRLIFLSVDWDGFSTHASVQPRTSGSQMHVQFHGSSRGGLRRVRLADRRVAA